MAKSPILGGFATQISPNAADNAAINLNVEIIETQDGKVPGFLRGSSGLDLLNTMAGIGLTLNVTASGGVVTAISIASGGLNYPVGVIGTIAGGNEDATFKITATSTGGVATGVTLLTGGTDYVTASGVATVDLGGPIRGQQVLNDVLYVVSGPAVYSLSPNGVTTLCGTIGDQKTPVSMFQNTRQLLLVDGVGAWLVPGGLPLTGGTIQSPGGLYAANDTIVLKAATGVQNAYPELTVTSVANNPVTAFKLPNTGSAYSTGTNIATTNIQPQPGGGSGLTIHITSVSAGSITAASVAAGGGNYTVGNTGIITFGSQDAVYQVTTVSGGAVTGFILLNRGTAYATAAAATTKAEPGIPTNVGAGFTVDITAAGAISASSVHTGGHGYVVGAVGFVSGGGGDATYLVTSVGPTGSVTGFTISKPGAIVDAATTFTQKSTTGSGTGFVLSSPTYGDFVGLVPIDVPFANPIVGDVSDGFGLLVFLDSQNIAASDEEDLSTWQPLSFGVANQSPDKNISIAVIHDEAFILKENNTEVWIDEGLANFPFAPITSVHIEFGCIAPFSVATAESELIFLSRNEQGQGVVIMLKGYTPVPISTQALVNEFQTYANLGDAIAYARQEGQHVYYVITFPEANKTWQYDKTSSALAGHPIWTQLAAFDAMTGDLNRHWGNSFTPFRVSSQPTSIVTSYQPKSVILTAPTILETSGGLVGLPTVIPAIWLSLWIDAPDSTGSGVIFSNQADDTLGSTNPGLFIKIENDTLGTPQLTIKAWDNANAIIVSATYDFTTWSNWVNIIISMDTVTNQIGVYANTIVAGLLVESHLTAVSLVWSSTNPIGASPTQPWHVVNAT